MRQGAYKLMKNKLSYNFYKFKYKKNEYISNNIVNKIVTTIRINIILFV